MSNSDIILTIRGVEIACGEKLPRLDILAYNGGLMNVPGWGALAIDLARRELGWSPQVDLAEGLRRTLAWMRSQPEYR